MTYVEPASVPSLGDLVALKLAALLHPKELSAFYYGTRDDLGITDRQKEIMRLETTGAGATEYSSDRSDEKDTVLVTRVFKGRGNKVVSRTRVTHRR